MSKTRCSSCSSKMNGIVMTCKLCETRVCISCLMPEIHKCIKLEEFKDICHSKHEKELLRNKCVKTKLEKI